MNNKTLQKSLHTPLGWSMGQPHLDPILGYTYPHSDIPEQYYVTRRQDLHLSQTYLCI